MKRICSYLAKWNTLDYSFKTILGSAIAFVINIGFIVFNGYLGIVYKSLWNIAIGVYYILLGGIRGYIVFKRKEESNNEDVYSFRKGIYIKTHIFLCIMNIAMIAPIWLMIHGDKKYVYGLIPAIVMATYTTYRIAMSSIQFRKGKRSSDLLVKELRAINLIDSIFSLLPLQNALIIANGGIDSGMQKLMGWTSLAIFVENIVITIRSLKRVRE